MKYLPVVLGSQENSDSDSLFSSRVGNNLDSKRLVVKTLDTGMDFNIGKSRSVIKGIKHVNVEFFKIGGQIINFDILDFNSLNVQFLVSVGSEMVLVFLNDVIKVLVKTEEGGVTSSSLEMFHDTWWHTEFSQGIYNTSKENVTQIVDRSIVVRVEGA